MISKIEKLIQDILEKQKKCIIAIDGMCGSGKTTLAKNLCQKFQGEIIHMDDFFLPISLRTNDRLSEIGGNIHYERFISQCIDNFSHSTRFSYDIFDCSLMDFNGFRQIKNTQLIIVEGAYALHNLFNKYWDLSVFVTVSPKVQKERIISRNGENGFINFQNIWIPMENKYFEAQKTKDKADIILLNQ